VNRLFWDPARPAGKSAQAGFALPRRARGLWVSRIIAVLKEVGPPRTTAINIALPTRRPKWWLLSNYSALARAGGLRLA